MLKAVIVDDESKSRQVLRAMLNEYCADVEVAGEAASPLEAIKLIQHIKPELVFLDVEMPGGSGFDILEAMPGYQFSVVFTTAYSQYAINAIKAQAIDYLLKPVNISDLEAAVQRVLEQRVKNQPHTAHRKLALPVRDGYTIIDLQQLIRVEGEGNYSTLHFVDQPKLIISKNLKYLDDRLPAGNFFRPHNSHLINCRHIQKYQRVDGGSIQMTDGFEVPLSRRKKERFLQLLEQWR